MHRYGLVAIGDDGGEDKEERRNIARQSREPMHHGGLFGVVGCEQLRVRCRLSEQMDIQKVVAKEVAARINEGHAVLLCLPEKMKAKWNRIGQLKI